MVNVCGKLADVEGIYMVVNESHSDHGWGIGWLVVAFGFLVPQLAGSNADVVNCLCQGMVRVVVFYVFQEPFDQYIVVVFCGMVCADLEVWSNLVCLCGH